MIRNGRRKTGIPNKQHNDSMDIKMQIINTGEIFDSSRVYLVTGHEIFRVQEFCEHLGVRPKRYDIIQSQVFVRGKNFLATVLVPLREIEHESKT